MTTGPDWQERITRDTNPAIRIEHTLRYRMAAPAIRSAPLWCDLGCGNGVAAAAALEGALPSRALLVDISEDALAHAVRELAGARTSTVEADLATPEGVARVRDELLAEAPEGGSITCFEVVEHLSSFVPLVEALGSLAEEHGFTAILSVPNDAFWPIENPFHQTMWGEGAFEELRRLLPSDHVVARQVALQGSCVAVEGAGVEAHTVELRSPDDAVPTHLLVAFGPEARLVDSGAAATATDLAEQRRWERQRESDLAFLQSFVESLRSDIEDLNSEAAERASERDEWRAYIHELERRLGLPLSGADGATTRGKPSE